MKLYLTSNVSFGWNLEDLYIKLKQENISDSYVRIFCFYTYVDLFMSLKKEHPLLNVSKYWQHDDVYIQFGMIIIAEKYFGILVLI